MDTLAGIDDESPPAFMQFFGEACSVPSVSLFGLTDEVPDGLSIWIRLTQDDEDQEERIYRALQTCRAESPDVPIDLHVVFADQPDDTYPQGALILFRRR